MTAGRPAAVVGVGHSAVYRRDDVPLGRLALDACRAAIADAGLAVDEVDAVACAPRQPVHSGHVDLDGRDFVSSDLLARALRLETSWTEDVNGFLVHSVVAAVNAVESGRARYALVCRALKGPSGTYGLTRSSEAMGPAQFDAPYGIFVPGTWAQLWQRYRDTYESGSREQMATLVVQARAHGLLWEHGYWAQHGAPPVTVEQYLASRTVSSPLSVLDCDLPVHGAAAFVITSAERARDLAQPPAYLSGVAPSAVADGRTKRPWHLEQEQATGRRVAELLWRSSGAGPADVDLANLYDGFSIIAILWLEALGFCGPGEGFDFIQDGRTGLGGELPLNTAGGNLGAGRMHGVPHLMDAVLQLQGRSGPRQIAGARTALVSIGQQTGGGALLLTADPDPFRRRA